MEITKKDVYSLFYKIKRNALKRYQKSNLNSAIKDISLAAKIAYLFNFTYKDDELEEFMLNISKEIIGDNVKFINSTTHKYVFIDSFGMPNKGLTQQYIRALMSLDVDFLYILANRTSYNNEICKEIQSFEKGTLCLIPDVSDTEKIIYVYQQISRYNPKAILAHIAPWDVVAVSVLYALSNIKRLNINLTDHAFWLGAGCFDYNIEFRDLGATISHEKRGFKKSQIVINAFYPIITESTFGGFPSETRGKIILFSGGNYNKIYGENGYFLSLLKCIVEQNTDAIILFAGTGANKGPMEEFILKNNLKDRIILIGERKDINEVFENCDIYLGTYPIGGGLMTQYAAYHGKPIIAFSKLKNAENKVEDLIFVNTPQTVQLTYNNHDDYLAEIQKLILDKKYRDNKGFQIKNALTTKDVFDLNLRDILNGSNNYTFSLIQVDYEKRFDQCLALNNDKSFEVGLQIFKRYMFLAFVYFPKVSFKYIPSMLKHYMTLFFKKGI